MEAVLVAPQNQVRAAVVQVLTEAGYEVGGEDLPDPVLSTGYRQEIIAINVLTGEVGRLAHHRSRSILQDYFASPRLSASWGGKVVGFASNFNRNGVNDIYMIPLSATFFPASISPTVPSQRSK